MAEGAVGLLVLLCLAGVVQATRDPDKTTARLGLAFGLLLLVGVGVFVARGDFFRASGLDDSGEPGCGYARTC